MFLGLKCSAYAVLVAVVLVGAGQHFVFPDAPLAPSVVLAAIFAAVLANVRMEGPALFLVGALFVVLGVMVGMVPGFFGAKYALINIGAGIFSAALSGKLVRT